MNWLSCHHPTSQLPYTCLEIKYWARESAAAEQHDASLVGTESILPELLVSPLGRSLAVVPSSHFMPLSRYILGERGGGNWSLSNLRVLFPFCWKFDRAGNWSWLCKTVPALWQQAMLIYHKDLSGFVFVLRPIPIHTLLHPQSLHMFWIQALTEIPLTPCHGAWPPIFPKAQWDKK